MKPKYTSCFRAGTHGWVIDMNRQMVRDMRQTMSGISLGKAKQWQNSAIEVLNRIIAEMAEEVHEQAVLHPEDLL